MRPFRESIPGTFVTDVAKGGLPYKAAKYHDYFTSALPAPQKGPDVTIPVSSGANLPVFALSDYITKPEGMVNNSSLHWCSADLNSINYFSYWLFRS